MRANSSVPASPTITSSSFTWLATANSLTLTPPPPGTTSRATAAHTIAAASVAANGISGAAACEKPIMPTAVGISSSTQHANSHPSSRSASQLSAMVAMSANNPPGKRAVVSLTPKSLKVTAAAQ